MDLKKMVRDAGSAVSRVVQMTEEKLGTSEKTELDAHFENLAERADITKLWTEKILKNTEAVLTPNPGNRVEDFLFEKIEKKKPNRLSNLEYLGQDMIDAANDFGPGTAYGSTLLKVGMCEQKVGKNEREFITNANSAYLLPLKKYLDEEMKTITTERGVLETKRLDLDSCKNRVRKARGMLGQPTAERDLRNAQADFDRQVEITKLLLESVGKSHASHLRYLHDFVDAQLNYYQQCVQALQELKTDISSSSPSTTRNSNSAKQQRARVLCSYVARSTSELNLVSDEVITIEKISDTEKDYVIAHRGSQTGKVPLAYLEIIE